MSWPHGNLDDLPLIRPSDTFSPTGGEGVRRTDEGASPNRTRPPVHRNSHSFIETVLNMICHSLFGRPFISVSLFCSSQLNHAAARRSRSARPDHSGESGGCSTMIH